MDSKVPNERDAWALIEKISTGDRQAWAELYSTYKRMVLAVCIAILKDEEEALDVAQETFVKVFNNAKSLNPNGNLNGWLRTVAANLCRDRLRKRQRGVRWLQQWLSQRKSDFTDSRIERTVQLDERDEALQDAIAELEDEFRLPLLLKYYSDLSYKEIAELLTAQEGKNVAEDTVGSRLNRAKGKLRKLLIERGVVPHE